MEINPYIFIGKHFGNYNLKVESVHQLLKDVRNEIFQTKRELKDPAFNEQKDIIAAKIAGMETFEGYLLCILEDENSYITKNKVKDTNSYKYDSWFYLAQTFRKYLIKEDCAPNSLTTEQLIIRFCQWLNNTGKLKIMEVVDDE